MRMSMAFMLGSISGAVFVGLWRRELRAYAAESSCRIRGKADGGASLRQAEEPLQGNKERIGTA